MSQTLDIDAMKKVASRSVRMEFIDVTPQINQNWGEIIHPPPLTPVICQKYSLNDAYFKRTQMWKMWR